MTLALEGTRVLDLSRTVPGPYCTMMLADMGAEVIKIEDPSYSMGLLPDQEKQSAYDFLSRNKKSIALNLKTAEAREVMHRLAADADVVIEAFRPGVTERLGVDYATLSRLNPRIVYCSLTGFGQEGPYRDLPGHDPNYISIAGAVGLTGDQEGNPVIIRAALGDIGSALHCVIGILCALMARNSTGKGQYIDISMTDSVLPFLTVSLLILQRRFHSQEGLALAIHKRLADQGRQVRFHGPDRTSFLGALLSRAWQRGPDPAPPGQRRQAARGPFSDQGGLPDQDPRRVVPDHEGRRYLCYPGIGAG